MYAIVAFVESNSVDWVPMKWLTSLDNFELVEDFGALVQNRTNVLVYWPPTTNPSSVSRARNRLVDREVNWPSYKCRILGTATTPTEARALAALAEDTSNIENHEPKATEAKRKRSMPTRFASDSSADDEDEDFHPTKQSEVIGIKLAMQLPTPPPPASHSLQPVVQHNLEPVVPVNTNRAPLPATLPSSSTQGQGNSVLLKVLSCLEELKQTQRVHGVLLQRILGNMNATVEDAAELPENIDFPLSSAESVQKLEELLSDSQIKKRLTVVLTNIGGSDLQDFVKRVMNYVLTPALSLEFNVTGQKGKEPFNRLKLFQVIADAARTNVTTKASTQKDLELFLRKFFTGARDRGTNCRKRSKPSSAIEELPDVA